MDEKQIKQIGNRLEKLEAQNRKMKRLGVMFGVVLVAGSAIGWAGPVEEQLVIKDRRGVVRFDIGVNKQDGNANAILIFDVNGRKRIDMGVDAEGKVGIALLNPDGSLRRKFD